MRQEGFYVSTITGDGMITAGSCAPRFSSTPEGLLGSLAVLIERAAQKVQGTEATIVLADQAPVMTLGLPLPLPKSKDGDAIDHPQLGQVRELGWKIAGLGEHMTFWAQGRPTIHMHVLPWSREEILGGDVLAMTRLMANYHRLTTGAWHTSPGTSGVGLLRERYAPRHVPYWKPDWKDVIPSRRASELPWSMWDAPSPERPKYVHGWDLNADYLSAAINASVAADQLRHTGQIEFDPKRAGYWLIERPVWNNPRLPDPCGPKVGDDRAVWVTTPTAELLAQLADAGVSAGPVVMDSWTNQGTRVLKAWGENLRDARASAMLIREPDGPILVKMIKRTYTETLGCLVRDSMRVHRPDWHHIVVGTARANLWRKIHAAATLGQYPLAIRTDSVRYGADGPDENDSRPATFKVDNTGMSLGFWKFAGSEPVAPEHTTAAAAKRVKVGAR